MMYCTTQDYHTFLSLKFIKLAEEIRQSAIEKARSRQVEEEITGDVARRQRDKPGGKVSRKKAATIAGRRRSTAAAKSQSKMFDPGGGIQRNTTSAVKS